MTSPSNEKRARPMVTITLSRQAIEMLDAMAEAYGQSRSATVERLVRERSQETEFARANS